MIALRFEKPDSVHKATFIIEKEQAKMESGMGFSGMSEESHVKTILFVECGMYDRCFDNLSLDI